MKKNMLLTVMLALGGPTSAEILWNDYYPPDMPASASQAGATFGHTIVCMSARDAVKAQNLVRSGDEDGFLKMYSQNRCEFFELGLEYFTETAQNTVAKHGMFLIDDDWELRWTTVAIFNQQR
ncbi:MAG: hypothetical protein AB8B60_09815 [Sulfitobacter sp.]